MAKVGESLLKPLVIVRQAWMSDGGLNRTRSEV